FSCAERFLDKICPILHHARPRNEILRIVIGPADLVLLLMCELCIDVLMLVTALMQNRGSHAPESMAGHFSLVSHALERLADRPVAHRWILGALAREEVFAFSRESTEELQNLDGLSR